MKSANCKLKNEYYFLLFQQSIIPVLHYSIFPILNHAYLCYDVQINILVYSYLNASIGSSRAALDAG